MACFHGDSKSSQLTVRLTITDTDENILLRNGSLCRDFTLLTLIHFSISLFQKRKAALDEVSRSISPVPRLVFLLEGERTWGYTRLCKGCQRAWRSEEGLVPLRQGSSLNLKLGWLPQYLPLMCRVTGACDHTWLPLYLLLMCWVTGTCDHI